MGSSRKWVDLTCSACGVAIRRRECDHDSSGSSPVRCKRCATAARNKSGAAPVGATRTVKATGYIEEKSERGWVRQHILVIERHLGRRLERGEVVHHKNEDRADNRLENLAVMSNGEHTRQHHIGAKRSDDQLRRITTAIRASRTARLTSEQAAEIRERAKTGVSQHQLARLFSVSPMTVNRIINNVTWKNIEC